MILDDIGIYLPKYLSERSYSQLFELIKQFPLNQTYKNFYTLYLIDKQDFFQGDGIKSLPFYNFQNNAVKKHKSIIISNSCDICSDNKRQYSTNLLYAPIVELDSYIEILKQENIIDIKINNHISDIKEQRISSIFYLPELNSEIKESIVYLDQICNIPLKFLLDLSLNETRYFSLSNYGFYIFLLKLSIHFTRIMENIDRVI